MTTFLKSAVAGLALTVLGAGAAVAAEKCGCCKEGAKMECCEKMTEKPASPAPGEQEPAQPGHQH